MRAIAPGYYALLGPRGQGAEGGNSDYLRLAEKDRSPSLCAPAGMCPYRAAQGHDKGRLHTPYALTHNLTAAVFWPEFGAPNLQEPK